MLRLSGNFLPAAIAPEIWNLAPKCERTQKLAPKIKAKFIKEHSQFQTQMFRFYIVWGHFETQTRQEEVNPWPIAWCRNCNPQKWTWPLFWQAWRVNSTPLNFSKKFKFLSQTLHLQGRTAPSKAPMIWHKKLTKLGTNKQLVQVMVGNGGKTSGRDRTESRWEGGEGERRGGKS